MSTPRSPNGSGWFSGTTMRAGARAILPLSIGAFPFGMAYGVTVVESPMNDVVGLLASFLVFAGAAQLAMIDLIDQGAPWFIIVGTALVINARMAMYSGALAPSFTRYPKRLRVPLSYFITDQATVTSLLFNEQEHDPRERLAYYIGAGASFAAAWWTGTAVGIGIGATVPAEFQVGFAVPLMFLALLVPSVRDRAALIAACVGFGVTIIARDAPLNSGLLIGAAAGIAFGMLAKTRGQPAAAEEHPEVAGALDTASTGSTGDEGRHDE